MTRPRLVTGARLRYDEVREEHLLLIPEGAVRLNPTAARGARAVRRGALARRHRRRARRRATSGADLRDDVQELVDAMAQKGLVVDAAA